MMVYRNAPVEVILLETCPLLYPVDDIDKVELRSPTPLSASDTLVPPSSFRPIRRDCR